MHNRKLHTKGLVTIANLLAIQLNPVNRQRLSLRIEHPPRYRVSVAFLTFPPQSSFKAVPEATREMIRTR